MMNKNLILASKVTSLIFTPFYLPLVALTILFLFSYLSQLPLFYKIFVLSLVYLMTILLPTFLIHIYRRYQNWSLLQMSLRKRRIVPYLVSILCYFLCLNVMHIIHIPHFMGSIVIAALSIQIVCAIVNVWWKISTHTAGIGGMCGAISAFSFLFFFNPIWWLSLSILLGGVVGTARMILRQHTLMQVVGGFLIGAVTAFFSILLI